MNIHHLGRTTLIALATALVVLVASPRATAAAQELPPRPTVVPAPPSTPEPTPPPTDASTGQSDGDPAPTGRITGTVIDQTDGAPVPGARVQVAEITLTSDANGNYDLAGLAAGTYLVTLAPAEGRGLPAQAPVAVLLAAGATVVQHLAFAARPLPAPAEPVAAPAAPAQLPAALPATSQGNTSTSSPGQAVALILAGLVLIWAGRRTLMTVAAKQ